MITGNGATSYSYLGRPWGPFGRVIFAYTWMDSCIKPAGWHNWDKQENEKSSCFYQYRCQNSNPTVCFSIQNLNQSQSSLYVYYLNNLKFQYAGAVDLVAICQRG